MSWLWGSTQEVPPVVIPELSHVERVRPPRRSSIGNVKRYNNQLAAAILKNKVAAPSEKDIAYQTGFRDGYDRCTRDQQEYQRTQTLQYNTLRSPLTTLGSSAYRQGNQFTRSGENLMTSIAKQMNPAGTYGGSRKKRRLRRKSLKKMN